MGRVWRRELSIGRCSLSLRRVLSEIERRQSRRRCRASLLRRSVMFLAQTSSLEPNSADTNLARGGVATLPA
eukprot:3542539-Pyramimonas_sp.AAC.1